MTEKRLTKEWEVSAFDRESNEWTTTMNHAYEAIPEIPGFINQAAPTRITPSRRKQPTRGDTLSVFFPDAQIPFHDEKAVEAAHTAVRELQPDNIIMLGDMLDLPAQSSFDTRPEYHGVLQQAIDRYHTMLAQVRADSPNANIYALTGNHEARMQKDIIKNNAELLGIKRANAQKELGVLTLDFLLRTEELEVNIIGGYPSGTLWLEDNIRVIHGTTSNSRGSTSASYLNQDPHTSVVHGHSHRAEIQWRTTPTSTGGIQRFGMSPGTLAQLDGNVPSHWQTHDDHGSVVQRVENWQQAVGVVEHNAVNSNPELAMIHNGVLKLRGKTYDRTQ